jgi:hypothetical protein
MSCRSLLTRGEDVGRRRGNKVSLHVPSFKCIFVCICVTGTFVPWVCVSTHPRGEELDCRDLFFNGVIGGWSEGLNRSDEEEDVGEDFLDSVGFDDGRVSGVSV